MDNKEELKLARAEGRVVELRGNNNGSMPVTLSVNHINTMLQKVPKHLRRFKLYMVTRRSSVNPGESFQIRLILPEPLAEYPKDAELKFRVGPGDSLVAWTLPLHGSTSK